MSTRTVQNFRGMQAAVLHPAGRDRDVIAGTLGKLGVVALVFDPAEVAAESALRSADLLVFDTDAPDEAIAACGREALSRPLIAVLGHETPSRLERAFDLAPAALLQAVRS